MRDRPTNGTDGRQDRLGTIVPFARGGGRIVPFRPAPTDQPPTRATASAVGVGGRSNAMGTLTGTGSTAGFGARATSDRTINHRGGVRPAAGRREKSTVYGTSMGMGHFHAEVRRQEMMAEAERERRLSQAGVGAGRPVAGAAMVALRRAIGSALVRIGERLQGVGAGEAAESYPSVATLRAAR